MDYCEDLAIEKQPKMRCDWTIKSISYFLTGPKVPVVLKGAKQQPSKLGYGYNSNVIAKQ